MIMALLMLFTGCQKKPSAPQQPVQGATTEISTEVTEQTSEDATAQAASTTQATSAAAASTAQSETTHQPESTAASTAQPEATPQPESTAASTAQPEATPQPDSTAATTVDSTTDSTANAQPDSAIPEDGTYTTKDDVALYIHTYGKLPENFITKKAAKKLGWQGGSLEDYAPGKCIGGDYFGNYEGLLPEDKEYHECDIDTLGKSKRGAKRIIYSDDGYIYYTGDHYESFELLYEP